MMFVWFFGIAGVPSLTEREKEAATDLHGLYGFDEAYHPLNLCPSVFICGFEHWIVLTQLAQDHIRKAASAFFITHEAAGINQFREGIQSCQRMSNQ